MKHPIYLTICISLLLLILLPSCRKEEGEIDREAGERLFESSARLIKTYSDSLEQAQDTTTLLRLEKSLTDKLAKLNFQVPPNTDLTLTEEENDSLAHVMKRFREKFDIRMKNMIRQIPADTVYDASLSVPRSVRQDSHPAVSTVSIDSITPVAGD